MYSPYRWWDRHRLQLSLAVISLIYGLVCTANPRGGLDRVISFNHASLPRKPTQQEQLVNARTWELEQRLAALESQNQALQALLKQPVVTQGKGTVAPVIGRSADHWWQQMTLGRGHLDAIREGAIVVAPGGLVGRVLVPLIIPAAYY
jgi:rod shape-determining protein MreC